MDLLQVSAKRRGDACIVTVVGELDVATADKLRQVLLQIADQPPPQLLLDVTQLSFMDSTGLGLLIAVRRRLAAGTAMHVVGAQTQVRKLFEITSLTQVFPLHDSIEEATRAAI